MSEPIVLIVVSDSLRRLVYQSALESMALECVGVSAEELGAFSAKSRCAGIVVELDGNAGSAVETVAGIRRTPGFERTPVILAAAGPIADLDAAIRSQSGPVDSILLPLSVELLRSRIGVLVKVHAAVDRGLHAEREWLFGALNGIHEEVYFTDLEGRYMYANPSAMREFGHESVEGVPVESIVSGLLVLRPDGTRRPLAEAPPLRALRGEIVNDEEQIVCVPRTGEFRHRLVSSAPVRNAQGAIIGSVSVARDVTEIRRSEARLREAVEEARAAEADIRAELAAELAAMKRLHDLSTIAIRGEDQQTLLEKILDATRDLHTADFGAIRLYDAQTNTLRLAVHRGFEQSFPDRFELIDSRDRTTWAMALERRERVLVEDVESSPDHAPLRRLAKWLGCRAMQSTPLFTAKGTPMGTLTTCFVAPRRFSQNELRLTDLYARQAGIAIERGQAEAALIAARESADHANKSKSHFLRAASHDLRQPVQTLAMLNESLRGSGIDARAQMIVEQQTEAIDTMAHLLDTLLDISKLEAGAVRPDISDFPVAPLVEKLRAEFSGLVAARGLELIIDAPGGPFVRSDPTLVGEILRNLISNAIKFTPRGAITFRCREDEGTVRFDVIDTGVGIPREELPLIFGEFYQVGVGATVSRQGYGLGLAIAQRMASMLQADIEVESEVGKGSRFSLTVSAGNAGDLPGAAPHRPVVPVSFNAALSTILLVEDHPAVRSAMELFLNAHGYRVVSAGSFDQTLAVIDTADPPELLITDFHLPGGKTGSDVIRSVRGVLGMNIPAIMISGDTSDDISALAEDSQVRFATKPIDPVSLVRLLQELLGGRG